jgi:NADPH:quinone reductase-like Zn-dependent oxidoreductase
MKAIVYYKYGSPDVLEFKETEKPAPRDSEVLIKVRAASVNPMDCGLLKGKPYTIRLFLGPLKPKDTRPGRDVAGRVEAVGRNVTRFKPGDDVFGLCIDDPKESGVAALTHCRGAFAEFACALESAVAGKPDNLTYEQAAAVPMAALSALQGLRDYGGIRAGQKVMIHGAGGGVGTFAVQIAKAFGADVTAVTSGRNIELVGSIGADRVIDYTRQDFTACGERFDLILDCSANRPLSVVRRVLKPQGTYVMVGGAPTRWMLGLVARPLAAILLSPFVSQKLITFLAKPKQEDLEVVRDLIATGKVRPVIDRCFELSEAGEAFRYLDTRQARGKVVIRVGAQG